MALVRSDRFKHPGVSNFNVSAGSPKTKLCPWVVGNPLQWIILKTILCSFLDFQGICIVPKNRVNDIDLSTSFCIKGWAAPMWSWKSVSQQGGVRVGTVFYDMWHWCTSASWMLMVAPIHPLLKLRHPGVVCRCLVVQIVIGLPQWESSIPTIHCLELC